MKTNFLFLISICFYISTLLKADCMGSNIEILPASKTLSKDSVIIIEAMGASQKISSELNKKYNVILKSKIESVKLNTIEILKGDFHLTQIVLKPEKPLIVGDTYELIIENSEKEPLLANINSKWLVTQTINVSAPTWATKPLEINKSKVQYGCGPAIYVNFSANISHKEPILIKANVTSKEKKTTTSFLIGCVNQTLSLGHGMCSGGFNFEDSKEYTVTFDIMRSNGDLIKWQESPISFISPE